MITFLYPHPPDANNFPSGLKVIELRPNSCPLSSFIISPVLTSHSATCPTSLHLGVQPAASKFPSGLKAIEQLAEIGLRSLVKVFVDKVFILSPVATSKIAIEGSFKPGYNATSVFPSGLKKTL